MNTKKFLATIWMSTFPMVVLAQWGVPTLPSDFWGMVDKIFNFLFGIFLVIAVIFFMLAAFTFVTAGGDPGKIETARSQLIWGIIGLFLAALSRGLVFAIRAALGV